MYYTRLDSLIYVLVALVPVGFITTYIIALMNDHVEAFLPYIRFKSIKFQIRFNFIF